MAHSARLYELRFFAKTAGLTGRAYAHVSTAAEAPPGDGLLEGAIPAGTAADHLYSPDITGTDWQEYRLVSAGRNPSATGSNNPFHVKLGLDSLGILW